MQDIVGSDSRSSGTETTTIVVAMVASDGWVILVGALVNFWRLCRKRRQLKANKGTIEENSNKPDEKSHMSIPHDDEGDAGGSYPVALEQSNSYSTPTVATHVPHTLESPMLGECQALPPSFRYPKADEISVGNTGNE
ncbi:hypothetical protein BJV82DRAFT_672240 [Fennellomyces sp. T-0311]|nr:hypothetical protein BJV82DRAFT_672240 [Fennellomyces sp. T-0311]